MRLVTDKEPFSPPLAPLDMPLQIIEHQHVPLRSWPAILRQLIARLAFHE